MTVTISGRGNLALIEPDAWPDLPSQLRRYDPEVGDPQRQFKKDGLWGKRSWSFLIIPDGGGRFTIPKHSLHYFDPIKGEYALAESKAIVIEVEGAPALAPTGAAAGTGAAEEPRGSASKREFDEEAPLAPIRGGEVLGRRAPGTRAGSGLSAGTWSWLSGLVPAAFAATWLGERAWARFGPDDSVRALAERHRASMAQLERAAGLVNSGDGFWTLLGELLQRSAVERLGPDAQGLTRGALAQRLLAVDIPEAEVQSWRGLLDRADAARYGAGGGDASSRQAAFDEASKLVRAKHWRPRR